MLPTLISVSVAPVSYFFCATAVPPIRATASAAAGSVAICERRLIAIQFPLLLVSRVGFCDWARMQAWLPRAGRQPVEHSRCHSTEHKAEKFLCGARDQNETFPRRASPVAGR